MAPNIENYRKYCKNSETHEYTQKDKEKLRKKFKIFFLIQRKNPESDPEKKIEKNIEKIQKIQKL